MTPSNWLLFRDASKAKYSTSHSVIWFLKFLYESENLFTIKGNGNSLGPIAFLFNHAINRLFGKACLDPERSLTSHKCLIALSNFMSEDINWNFKFPRTYLSFFLIDEQWHFWNGRFAHLSLPSNLFPKSCYIWKYSTCLIGLEKLYKLSSI